ncbi:MAG: DUF5694 domain-containing protein [Bacteroidota bacterium]
MRKSKAIFLLIVLCSCEENLSQKEVIAQDESLAEHEALLIGTFHYNNPGADVAKTKTFDILSSKSQGELSVISGKIKAYEPTKIFVEWPHDEQSELDSLYTLYLRDEYFSQDSLSEFYIKNEIFQLAFRAGKELGLEKIRGIDYSTSFPFEEVMQEIQNANQSALMSDIQDGISKFTYEFDSLIEQGTSLIELTYHLNSSEMRKFSNRFHNELMLLAGSTEDFSGPLLTSEWYKRNLYMWSLIQKNIVKEDERILILVGVSHAAMFELFINENEKWQVIELREIMD